MTICGTKSTSSESNRMTQIAPMGGFPNRFPSRFPNVTKGLRTLCASLAFLGMFSLVDLPLASAKNPFLSASTDDRAPATFSGTEWGDDLGPKDLPLSCKVVTQRLAKLAWGEVYSITFESVSSKTSKPRGIAPLLLVVTDKEIIRIQADKPNEAVEKIKGLTAPPKYEPVDLIGLSQGTRTYKETALTVAKITVKGNTLRYTWNHNSGHFLILEWQRGVGLTEISQNRGARSDGYKLRRGVMPLH